MTVRDQAQIRGDRTPIQRMLSSANRSTILTTAFAIVFTIIFMWPAFTLIAQSLNSLDTYMDPLIPWPKEFSLKLYQKIFTEYELHHHIRNTVYVVLMSTALGTFASALSGYALAKLNFPGRQALFIVVIAFMLLPLETMMVPRFIVLKDLDLINSYWGLILPAVGGNAFGIFLMRQFMMQIPNEMLDAGRVDGCSEFGLFWRLVLPNMKGPLLVLVTFSVRGGWNSFLWPQIVITEESKQLIMPAIARLNQLTVADPYARHVVLAAALLSALVPLAFYMYSQKFFVSALAGSIKG
jgi:multiple sugar transport system permease protein